VYVSHHWSYRSAHDAILLRNEITGREAVTDGNELAALERLAADRSSAAVISPGVRGLEIVFDDEWSADAWLTAQLSPGELEVPVVDQIELTNRCPYTCVMCPRTTSMERPLGAMPLDLFERIVEQVAPAQNYTALHHFGESLVYRYVADAVALARDKGVLTGLSCNPPSLTPAIGQRLLDAGLRNTVLSLDSLDPDTYRAIRGRAANLEKANRNLRAFVELRDRGGYDTWITLQMIRMDTNQDEIDGFLRYCADVGVDRGVVIRLGRWDFDDERVDALGGHDSPGHTAPCALPYRSVAVLWDGRVVPCCHDYDGAVVLGSLATQTLAEVWHGPEAQRFREHNDQSRLCQECAFSRWFRRRQREREGFLAFHRSAPDDARRYEWVNPACRNRESGATLFDRFDVYATG
jgi:radical SAM protein with 4Fe4S-binding SPASM domain